MSLVDNRKIPQPEPTVEEKFRRFQELNKKKRMFELQQKESGIGDITLAEEPEFEINLDPDKAVVPQPEPIEAPTDERFPTGAVVGGTIGTGLGIPLGFPGMAFGGTLGSAGGEAIQQIIEQLMSDPNAPKTVKEALRRIGQEGIFGLIAEAGGQGVVRGARALKNKALGPFAGSLTLEDTAAREAFERLGIQPTPFEVVGRTFLGRIERFAEQGLISGGIFKRFNNTRVKLFKAFQNRFLEDTGPKKVMSALGDFTKSTLDDVLGILDKEAGRLFTEAQELAGESAIIPTQALKDAAQGVLDREDLVTKGLQFRPLQRLAKEMLELPEKISYESAREFQKRFGAKLARLKNLPEGEMKQLFKGISESIESAEFKGQKEGAESLVKLREAKDRFIELKNLEESGIAKSILNKDPEDVFRSIFQKGDVTNIKALRNIVGERDWPMFQRAFADDLLSRGNIENFNQILDKQQLESLQQVFSNEQIQVLQDIATVAERFRPDELVQASRVKPGFNLINIGQGGLMLNLATNQVKGNRLIQGLIVLSPAMIAKALTSEGGVKWLTIGLRLKNDHPLGAQVIENITNVLVGSASRSIAADPKTRKKFIRQFKDAGLPVEIFFPDVQRPDGSFKDIGDMRKMLQVD